MLASTSVNLVEITSSRELWKVATVFPLEGGLEELTAQQDWPRNLLKQFIS